ncbi:hypothetical protein [Candidatus Nitrotoga sp. M5]|uniref:hypothetical protein n=1 Tax=Candidatus Nitrotoga sp. M5 TaxID=2890409 RepID=UPI001EF6121B|nr:hypothetical protein [Candidatus Nitrotoga sp. M5]CAH1387929.1 hypothetical protein NTGM5_740004 [Candidatus Nitrotoga sp. M5]
MKSISHGLSTIPTTTEQSFRCNDEFTLTSGHEVSFKLPNKKGYFLLLFIAISSLSFAVSSTTFAQEVVEWECRVEGKNDGCQKFIRIPSGKKIVSVKAACNLEHGAVSDSQLASASDKKITVVRKSDRQMFRPNGYCYVATTKAYKGETTIKRNNEVNGIRIGCKEHDENGGDCHIRGIMTLSDGEGTSSEK